MMKVTQEIKPCQRPSQKPADSPSFAGVFSRELFPAVQLIRNKIITTINMIFMITLVEYYLDLEYLELLFFQFSTKRKYTFS